MHLFIFTWYHCGAINSKFLSHDFLWLRGPCFAVVNVSNSLLVLISQKIDPEKALRFWEISIGNNPGKHNGETRETEEARETQNHELVPPMGKQNSILLGILWGNLYPQNWLAYGHEVCNTDLSNPIFVDQGLLLGPFHPQHFCRFSCQEIYKLHRHRRWRYLEKGPKYLPADMHMNSEVL